MSVLARLTSVLQMPRQLSSLLRASATIITPTGLNPARVSYWKTLRSEQAPSKRPRVSIPTVVKRVYLIKTKSLVPMTCVWVPLPTKGVAAHLHRTLLLNKRALQWIKSVIQIMDPPPGRFHQLRQSRTFLQTVGTLLPQHANASRYLEHKWEPLSNNRPLLQAFPCRATNTSTYRDTCRWLTTIALDRQPKPSLASKLPKTCSLTLWLLVMPVPTAWLRLNASSRRDLLWTQLTS